LFLTKVLKKQLDIIMNKVKKKQPLVSIIMNCRDGENFLHRSISSVINQTYSNWELIFWDNLSKDKSKNILFSFRDNRIKYFKAQKLTTLYQARNLAVKKSKGKFISFLDVDDWWSPYKLEKQLRLFSNKNVGLVYSKYYKVFEKFKIKNLNKLGNLPTGKITQQILDIYEVGVITLLIRRSFFKKINFDKKFNIIGDFDFVIRLSQKTIFDAVQEPLAYYRLHNNNLSQSNLENGLIKELKNWLEIQKRKKIIKKFSLKKFEEMIAYLHIKNDLIEGKKRKAFKLLKKQTLSKKKIKYIIALSLPTFILKSLLIF